ncbi:MAG: 50S ribosomal protein L9 [Patescibacteria group bacterium]
MTRVVLIKDVKGLGKKMEVKDVADGYARNFLIPRQLATLADEKILKEKFAWDANIAQDSEDRTSLAKQIGRKEFIFFVKTGEQGQIFESVHAEDIDIEIAKHGFAAGKAILERPIKVLGMHDVVIDFGKGIKGTAKVRIEAKKK